MQQQIITDTGNNEIYTVANNNRMCVPDGIQLYDHQLKNLERQFIWYVSFLNLTLPIQDHYDCKCAL
jgi:hypothetical protein